MSENNQLPCDRDTPPSRQFAPHHKLRERVERAAETALAHGGYVAPIDLLNLIGFLAYSHIDAWRKGRIEFLAPNIQGSPQKISTAMELFRQWALTKGLQASEARYVRQSPSGMIDLRFTESGDPDLEKTYSTHYVSAALPETKQKRIQLVKVSCALE